MNPSRIKLNSALWPVVTVVLFLLQLVTPFKGWLMLLIGLGGLWLFAWIWARALKKNISFRREMRYGWAQVGDTLEERFHLGNDGLLPAVWVEIRDHSTIPDYNVSRGTGVAGESVNSWLTRQVCTRRGLFTLGPAEIITGDPFGIYTVTIPDPRFATLLVTPPVLPLPQIQIASGGRTGDGRPTREALESSISTAGVRGYLPGDQLRRVHWPTSARRNAFFVKTFENTPASDWWILLDLDKESRAGSGSRSTEEAGIILAASLADRGLRAGLQVGLIATSSELIWLPPRAGEGQRWEILKGLATASLGKQPLEEILKRSDTTFRYQTSLVLITACADSGWLQPLLSLAWKGVIPTVILLDPSSFGGSPDISPLAETLAGFEIAHYWVTADMLEPKPERPEELNTWDWRVMPTGKAVPVQKPKDLTWKSLL